MGESKNTVPDNTAVRTALWRGLHAEIDDAPHVIEDVVGLRLAAPAPGWQDRPDMHPSFTRRLRASMVARARFVDDFVVGAAESGITQYVILGAGLDTFCQRRQDVAPRLEVYEVDQPDTQAWKRARLIELGYGIPSRLHFVPVDFEASSWWDRLVAAGFDAGRPAVMASTGVTLYLTKEAITDMLHAFRRLAPASRVALSFYLPMDMLDPLDRPLQEIADKGAREAGTPFVSFFSPGEILALAQEAGFQQASVVTDKDLFDMYFASRNDQLVPASGEEFLILTV